jgi:large subunit ribosomal protein L22
MARYGVDEGQIATRTTRKGMTYVKTNERVGTRAQVRYVRVSAYKAREVLDLIRGLPVDDALDVLRYTDRAVADVVRKCLQSAVANARENDQQDEADLFVSACYADEGPTLKRWRPRARGRATRIRKRTCHVTVIVGRMPTAMAERVRDKRQSRIAGVARPTGRGASEARRARVARSRRQQADHDADHDHEHDAVAGLVDEDDQPTSGVAEPEVAEPEVAEPEVAEPEVAEPDVEDADETASDSEPNGGKE